MEVKAMSGLKLIALALVLFLLITSNLALENEWNYIRNRRDAGVMEENSIAPSKAVKPFISEVKKREKRFVFLLPLLPLFGGLTAGTIATGAAVASAAVVSTAVVGTLAERPGLFSSPTYHSSSTYDSPRQMTIEARRPIVLRGSEPREDQSMARTSEPKKAPKKAEDLTAFPGLEEAKPKTPVRGGGGLRKRWKDKKGKIYEWDSEKGEVEVYNKRGKKHEGGFDPYEIPPKRISRPDPTREVEP